MHHPRVALPHERLNCTSKPTQIRFDPPTRPAFGRHGPTLVEVTPTCLEGTTTFAEMDRTEPNPNLAAPNTLRLCCRNRRSSVDMACPKPPRIGPKPAHSCSKPARVVSERAQIQVSRSLKQAGTTTKNIRTIIESQGSLYFGGQLWDSVVFPEGQVSRLVASPSRRPRRGPSKLERSASGAVFDT